MILTLIPASATLRTMSSLLQTGCIHSVTSSCASWSGIGDDSVSSSPAKAGFAVAGRNAYAFRSEGERNCAAAYSMLSTRGGQPNNDVLSQ